ncbi:MAG: hypothetical protein IPL40_09150 [Proteobacteria bacterium]|nr:hypothetical protein [Pseudomonadota bacterium]
MNMVETEIGVMVSQCLDRRIPTEEHLVKEVRAWEKRRNLERARTRRLFTLEKARRTLGRSYPDRAAATANQAAA